MRSLDVCIKHIDQQNLKICNPNPLFSEATSPLCFSIDRVTHEELISSGLQVRIIKQHAICSYMNIRRKSIASASGRLNPTSTNGSLMDIGVYPLSVDVDRFGAPDSLHASGSLLASGADAHGTLTLGYGHFEVVITHSEKSAIATFLPKFRASTVICRLIPFPA